MRKILIIKLAALGDVLRTTSFLKPLRKKHNAEIHWLTSRRAMPLLEGNPYIDRLLIDNDKDIEEVLKGDYGLVLSLEEEEEMAETATKLREKGAVLIGVYRDKEGLKYTPDTNEWFDMSLISRFGKEKADALKKTNKRSYQEIWMDILGLEKRDYEPVLVLSDEENDFAYSFAREHQLYKNGLIIGFNTGAGKRWPMKSLSEEKTAWMIDRVKEELNAEVLLFGGGDEAERNNRIIKLCRHKPLNTGINSLRRFAALIGLTDVMVTADTLALHISLALHKRVVAFFAPTSAAEIELYGRGVKIISHSDCYCCYRKEYIRGGCIEHVDEKEILRGVVRLAK